MTALFSFTISPFSPFTITFFLKPISHFLSDNSSSIDSEYPSQFFHLCWRILNQPFRGTGPLMAPKKDPHVIDFTFCSGREHEFPSFSYWSNQTGLQFDDRLDDFRGSEDCLRLNVYTHDVSLISLKHLLGCWWFPVGRNKGQIGVSKEAGDRLHSRRQLVHR